MPWTCTGGSTSYAWDLERDHDDPASAVAGRTRYARMNVNPQRRQSDFRVVPPVLPPGAPISTRARYGVEDRRPGVDKA
ncbi:hypothetical protein [Pseudonocardia sp.]|uniref:hypothetical protein n=1 Tax=Pseudonocardia sp. TaxID=60912 RepID=UPI002625606C|nr:hypothetical protein [Pseudonocardia sp.]MCW2716205.1 phoD [Pseudonocardia sp.]